MCTNINYVIYEHMTIIESFYTNHLITYFMRMNAAKPKTA